MSASLLITGGSGFLGGALRALAPEAAFTYFAHPPGSGAAHALDVRDADAVARLIERLRPAAVVHTAYTNDPASMRAVIVDGSRHIAAAAHRYGAALVHVSTDQVFDGEHPPYDETSRPAPVLPYGEAKAEAEYAVRAAHPEAVIARTSILYSLDPPDPRLVRTRSALERGETISLFTDERRCPAHVRDVARALLAIASSDAMPPIVHLVGPEALVRHDFDVACLRAIGVRLDGVRAGTILASGIRRPRDLTLRASGTPSEITRLIRPLSHWIATPIDS